MAESVEPTDLASWLASVGAPESITSLLPKELRDIDVGAVLNMFGGMDISRGESDSQPTDWSSDRAIQWLPVLRE
jgi:hypothetical protein